MSSAVAELEHRKFIAEEGVSELIPLITFYVLMFHATGPPYSFKRYVHATCFRVSYAQDLVQYTTHSLDTANRLHGARTTHSLSVPYLEPFLSVHN